jgi:hypothetical protein
MIGSRDSFNLICCYCLCLKNTSTRRGERSVSVNVKVTEHEPTPGAVYDVLARFCEHGDGLVFRKRRGMRVRRSAGVTFSKRTIP